MELRAASQETDSQGKELEESELRLAQLQHQLPSNEPGALMHLMVDAEGNDEVDLETKECKNLFKDMKFFLSREVGMSLKSAFKLIIFFLLLSCGSESSGFRIW